MALRHHARKERKPITSGSSYHFALRGEQEAIWMFYVLYH